MPPPLALILTIGFIVFVFRRDAREGYGGSKALWLPVIWFFLLGSRYASHWLATLRIIPIPVVVSEEGSPLDRLVFLGLILAGMRILYRRRVTLRALIRNNGWIVLFLLYGLIAILWSDFPLVSLKRWIKVLGHPVMALIVLTEPNVEQAIVKLFNRCAYVILPVSILLLKYFPELGRGFDPWTGQAFNRGVTLDKNALGYDCMIFAMFYVWRLIAGGANWRTRAGKEEILHHLGFLSMAGWLLMQADSKTPLLSLILAVIIMVLLGIPFIDKRHFGVITVAGIAFIVILETGLGLYSGVLKLLGRNATLTDRTLLWEELLKFDVNPVVGTGFESFWLGSRMDALKGLFHFLPNQAHNGYLETYLNLGVIGVVILAGVILATFVRISGRLVRDFQWARFRMGYLFAIVLYNWTEASFKGLHLVWFVFYLIAMEYPGYGASRKASAKRGKRGRKGMVMEPCLARAAA